MSLQSDICIECERWSQLDDLEHLVEKTLQVTIQESGKKIFEGAEVSLLFCDDTRIQDLNRDWRKLDKPTNVLSFPAASVESLQTAPILGDIVIAFETVFRESAEENKRLRDHTCHMIVHGLLHLLGYDHEVEEEAEEMENLERKVLSRLRINDPYAATELVNGKKAP